MGLRSKLRSDISIQHALLRYKWLTGNIFFCSTRLFPLISGTRCDRIVLDHEGRCSLLNKGRRITGNEQTPPILN